MKRFSVIIPTYNRCHLLWKTLISLQRQSYSDFEILVIDDGSIDKTKALVKEFQADSRIKYFYKENGGSCSARNYGLAKAQGDIIAYVDSDEEVYSNFLEVALHFFNLSEEHIFAISNYNRVLEQYDDDFNCIKKICHSSAQKETVTFKDIYNWNIKTCGTGIFHRNISSICWDEKVHLLEDLDFLINLGITYPSGFFHIPYALFEYRQRYNTDGLCSQASYDDFSKAFKAIYDKFSALLPKLNPEVFLGRYESYKDLEKKQLRGEIPPMKDYIFQ